MYLNFGLYPISDYDFDMIIFNNLSDINYLDYLYFFSYNKNFELEEQFIDANYDSYLKLFCYY